MDTSLAVTIFLTLVILSRMMCELASYLCIMSMILFATGMTLIFGITLIFTGRDVMSGLFLLVICFNFAQTFEWMLTLEGNK